MAEPYAGEAAPDPHDTLPEAKDLAAAMPALLVEARRISATILAGWHGRRRAGPGETFWQFRPFVSGEPAATIDWRRSARDEHLYVREKEWEAAHTLWLAPDLSASMAFRSRLAAVDKRTRTVVLTLALADLLARAGERVGVLGLGRPYLSRIAAEKIARAMIGAPPAAWLGAKQLRRFSDVVVFSDFLDPIEEITARFDSISATGARAHLVQVLDPIEETFPYTGRTEFRDPESGFRKTIGRAETIREEYRDLLAARRVQLREICARLDWTFLVHHTARPAVEPLLALHVRLGDRKLDWRRPVRAA
jgi:uncharacterized protein (DUF58 family)